METEKQSEADPFERLEQRRIERERERMDLSKRLSVLNQEAADDAVALKVLRRLYPEKPPKEGIVGSIRDLARREPERAQSLLDNVFPAPKAAISNKQMILKVLKDAHPTGLSAGVIGGRVLLKFKTPINSNTLSVSLARLKADGAIRLEGKAWFYVKTTEYRATPVEMELRDAMANGDGSHVEAAE